MATNSSLILDACCLLNVCASGCLDAIAEALGHSFVIAEAVSYETLYIRRDRSGQDIQEREVIDLAASVRRGLLSIAALDEAELVTFLTFASLVDDGEAATCALAIHRGLPLATDDRKARRLLQAVAPHLRLFSTLELLKQWADHCQVDAVMLTRTLIAVRDRGNFLPPKADPLRGWWQTSIGSP
jgi:predicted nucleic acid-binding protein